MIDDLGDRTSSEKESAITRQLAEKTFIMLLLRSAIKL